MKQFLLISMICASGLILLASADHKGHEHGQHQHPNRHFVGLFESETAEGSGSFFTSHICEERETSAIYFATGLVNENGVEGASFIGRDVDGAENIGGGIFQISGELYTTWTGVGVDVGTWEMNYDSNTDVYLNSADIPGVLVVDGNVLTKVNGRAHSHHRDRGGGGGGGPPPSGHQFVREEYRCFVPYGGPLNTEYPQAFKSVQSGKNKVDEDEKTDPVLYWPIETSAGCYEWQGHTGVHTTLGHAYEGRLSFSSFSSATATACPVGSMLTLVVAENLQYVAFSCADGAQLGTRLLFELDPSDAEWHSCPIGP